MNPKQNIWLPMSRQMNQKNNIKIDKYSFDKVEEFKYLGVNINEKYNMNN